MLADQRVCWHVAGNACNAFGVGFGCRGLYGSGCQLQDVLAGCAEVQVGLLGVVLTG